MRGRWLVGVCLGIAVAAAGAATPRFDALRQTLDSQHIGTVEALIAALPEDLRRDYTLAFSSRSLQGASFQGPRAILYGTAATFIVTFNGDAHERGYATVETLEFDANASRFVLREIAFAANGAADGVAISAPNPPRCLACHGTPARPVWDAPPAWPGIYGERYGAGLSPPERTGIAAFLARQASHPRYRYLIDAPRFAARATYVPSGQSVYNGESRESPNARLSSLLAALNARSILADLVAQPGFPAHRYALLAATSAACGAPPADYPEDARAAVEDDYRAFRQRALAAARAEATRKRERGASAASARGAGATSELDALRFVAEQGLGLATDHWALALERGGAAPSAPAGASALERALFELVAATDPAVRSLAAYRGYTAADGYCAHLHRASRRELAAWYERHARVAAPTAAAPAATPAAVPALIARCAGCHTGEIGPSIPFADPAALPALLTTGDYPRGRLLDEILYRLAPEAGDERMPRGTLASAADERELEDYFLSLLPRPAGR